MPQTTWNKATVPVGTDPYSEVPDTKKAIETAGLVFAVSSDSERAGLAAKAPGGVLPVPTLIYRTDLGLYQTWDGSAWKRETASTFRANTQTVGAGMSTDAFVTGTLKPIIQAGTYVGTTSGNGDLSITYPQTFPNGVIGGIGFSGDGVYIVSATPTSVASPTTTSLFLRFANPNGSVVANTQVRGTWIAVGW